MTKEKVEKTKKLIKTKKTVKKQQPEKKAAVQKKEVPKLKKEHYFESVGRRKTAVARVRIFLKSKEGNVFLINEKLLEKYFQTRELQQIVLLPLKLNNNLNDFKVMVKVKGGGTVSQAEAIRHGIARCLILFDSNLRKKLKSKGYLKRDPRMRERKKFGLKRARRAPQWSKR